MSTVSNDFASFTIVNVDPDSPSRGPFIVSQLGTDPADTMVRQQVFLMTRSGDWVAWASVLAIPGAMADELLFDSVAEIVKVIDGLAGKAKIRKMDVDPKESLAKIEMVEAAGGLRVAIKFLLDKRKEAGRLGH